MAELGWRGDLVVSFAVSDLAAARDWYRDTLGFEVVYDAPEFDWCEVQLPTEGATLGLNRVDTPTPKTGALTLGVDDIDGIVEELRRRGADVDDEIRDIGGIVRLTAVRDPDGNDITFAGAGENAGES